MNQVNLFIELTRLRKPIGFMLLFWPCAWGLTLAYDFSESLYKYFFFLILFFLGSVFMRSAGCIVNDVLDKEFDAKVFRTKDRPIASGKTSVKLAIFYALLLCFLALIILLNFNKYTIILALGSMPLAFSYPLMKRFTYWPQLFLGITFNYGLILGWTAVTDQINTIALIFYIGAIFWTLGYDTIYGYQDIKDDEIIGLKSTSIKFKRRPYALLFSCYSIFLLSLLIVIFLQGLNKLSLLIFSLIIIQMFYFQLKKLNIDDPSSCLKIFKSNNYLGFVVLFALLIGKI